MAEEDPAPARPRRKRPRTTWPWLLVAAAVVLIWAAVMGGRFEPGAPAVGMEPAADRLAQVIRHIWLWGLVCAGATWLALYLATLRGAGWRKPAGFLAVLAVLGLASSGLGTLAAAVALRARTEAALSKIVAQNQQETAAAGRAYNADLEATGYLGVLETASLRRDPDLSRARRSIAQAREVLARHGAAADARVERVRAQMAGADLDRASKAELMAGLETGLATGRAEAAQVLRLQAQAIDATEEIIAFLDRRKGSWRLRGEDIQFSSDADLRVFRAHRDRLLALEARGRSLDEARERRAKASVDRVRAAGLDLPPG